MREKLEDAYLTWEVNVADKLGSTYRLWKNQFMENFVEDPATGSANGDLAGYLLEHDYFGKREAAYTVLQGEDMGRPSVLQIHAKEAEGRWLIEVGGRCHIVAQGDWA